MERLILADDIQKKLARKCDHCDAGCVWHYDGLCVLVDQCRTVDAVQVVRCKDCKYWWKENGLCMHKRHTDGNLCIHACGRDSFCSDGERKNKKHESD